MFMHIYIKHSLYNNIYDINGTDRWLANYPTESFWLSIEHIQTGYTNLNIIILLQHQLHYLQIYITTSCALFTINYYIADKILPDRISSGPMYYYLCITEYFSGINFH